MTVNPPDPDVDYPKEPLLSPAFITAAAAAVLGLIVAFGVDLTEKQTAGILGLAAVLAPVVVWLVGRNRVYSKHSVKRLMLRWRLAAKETNQTAERRHRPPSRLYAPDDETTG